MKTLRSLPSLRLPSRSLRVGLDPVTLIVHLVWLGLFAHVLWFVARFGIHSPYQDEWYFTGVLAANELNWDWVWALHSEHRYPIGKILYWCLTTWTGDFRTGALVTAILNGATALGMLTLARRLRGRTSLVDVLFPALVLNWGQFENYLFGYQIVFSLTSTGMAVILAAAALFKRERALACGLAAGASLLVVVQGGGYGLVAVAPVAIWIAIVAWGMWTDGERTRAGLLMLGPILAAAHAAIVLGRLERNVGPSLITSTMDRATVFLQAIGCGLGDGAATLGHPLPVLGMVILAAYAGALIRLLLVFVREPAERCRVLGIAGVIAWSLVSSLAIAMVRNAGYAPRYAGPASVGVCALLITAIVYGPTLSPRSRTLVALAALAAALGLVIVNVPTARYVGKQRRDHFRGFQRDLTEGMPARYLASKYGDILFFPGRPLANHITPLAKSGYQTFRSLRSDPSTREIPLASLSGVILAAATEEAFRSPGVRPSLLLWSGLPREIQGVRLGFALQEPAAMLVLVVKDEAGRVAAVYRRPAAGEHEALFWIGRTVSELRLEPASLTPEIMIFSAILEVPSE